MQAQPAFNPLVLPSLAAILTTVESLRRRQETLTNTPEGSLIPLRNDGRRTHVIYHAPPHLRHAPCVIFEAGANSWSPMWQSVSEQVETFARVLRYDRPGFGFSDAPSQRSRSIGARAEDLQRIVCATGARGPYVLVAHSLGALYINLFMRYLRPHGICGVVYVDAASPETVRMLENVVPKGTPPRWLASLLGVLGILRIVAPILLRPYLVAFKGELRRIAFATWTRGEWLLSYTSEWCAAINAVKHSRMEFPPGWLGNIPVAVLVPDVYERTKGKGYIGLLQTDVAGYSSDATVVRVKDCGHFVQLEKPEVVVEAVEMVIRRGTEREVRGDEGADEGAGCRPVQASR